MSHPINSSIHSTNQIWLDVNDENNNTQQQSTTPKNEENDEQQQHSKMILSIQTDSDYLYRFIRNQHHNEFFQSIDYYIQDICQLPFDQTGRVHLFDTNDDKSIIPTISLLDAIYSIQQQQSTTTTTTTTTSTNTSAEQQQQQQPHPSTFLYQFIGKYFIGMNEELFTYLTTNIHLLRIFVTNFPSWFTSFTIRTPPSTTTFKLCPCLSTLTSLSSPPTTTNHLCFCSIQDKILYERHSIEELLSISLTLYSCYPCSINGKFPTTIILKPTHPGSMQHHYPYKVIIEYSSTDAYQDILLSIGKYSLAQTFTSLVTQHYAVHTHSHLNWNTEQQLQLYLYHIQYSFKSIMLYQEPNTFARILSTLQPISINWFPLLIQYLSTCSNSMNSHSIPLSQLQQEIYQLFHSLLQSFISHRSLIPSQLRILEISTDVYNMLCYVLEYIQLDIILSNSFLKHIFIYYLPYLCPYHLSIILYVLPLSLLQTFHPSMFTHFNSNSKPFKPQQSIIIPHSSLLSPSQYNRIQLLQNERSTDPIQFPLSLLPIHPFSLLSAYLSPHQYDPIKPLPKPVDSSQTATPTSRTFSPTPLFLQQLYNLPNTNFNISAFIDPHLSTIPFPTSFPSPYNEHLLIYFKPKVELNILNQTGDRHYIFINGLLSQFNIQSFVDTDELTTYTFPVTNFENLPAIALVGPHNKDYFKLFHDDVQKQILSHMKSMLPIVATFPGTYSPFELFFELGEKSKWIAMNDCIKMIQTTYKSDLSNLYSLENELSLHFKNRSNFSSFWDAFKRSLITAQQNK